MTTILLAFGTMLLVMLAIIILPVNLTMAGKLIVVVASLVLSLVGLAASLTFPLWQTLLMLVALVIVVTYLLNARAKKLLYPKMEKKRRSNPIYHINVENKILNESFSLAIKEAAPAFDSIEEIKLPDEGLFYPEEKPQLIPKAEEELLGILDDDISFLLNRDYTIDDVKKVEESTSELNYLSEIESLIINESGETSQAEKQQTDFPTVLADNELPVLSFEEVSIEQSSQTETLVPLAELEEIPVLSFDKTSETKK